MIRFGGVCDSISHFRLPTGKVMARYVGHCHSRTRPFYSVRFGLIISGIGSGQACQVVQSVVFVLGRRARIETPRERGAIFEIFARAGRQHDHTTARCRFVVLSSGAGEKRQHDNKRDLRNARSDKSTARVATKRQPFDMRQATSRQHAARQHDNHPNPNPNPNPNPSLTLTLTLGFCWLFVTRIRVFWLLGIKP